MHFPIASAAASRRAARPASASRGNDGEITFRDWHPVGAEEYGYVAPDPLDPDIVYGGKLTRYDRRTAQAQNVAAEAAPRPDYRVVRTEPVVFSPVDPHISVLRGEHAVEDARRRPDAGSRSVPT